MQAILVHNPTAGDGSTSPKALIDLLHKARITPFYQSSKIGELTAALRREADLVVVAGGDGTVAKVLTQMPDRKVPVAILPLGTANNIASSFGIGGPLDLIAMGLHEASRRRLDMAMAYGPWGCCSVVEGIGLGALVRTAEHIGKPDDESREDKLKAARKALRKILKKAEPDRLRILVDDEPLPEEQLMVEVLNIACAGPRLKLVPSADMGDGKLDVVLLEPGNREAMRDWLDDDRPEGPPPLTRWRGRKVSIFWDGTPMHVDDDLPPAEDGSALVELALEGKPATILVP